MILFVAGLFFTGIQSTIIFASDSDPQGKVANQHKKAAQEIQDSLNTTAKSSTGYFTIQDMVVLKPGQITQLDVHKNPLKSKWIKFDGKVEKNSRFYFVDYNGTEAILTGPNLMHVDLLKLEAKKQTLDNGFIVRVSMVHKTDLKVWLHNPEISAFKNFKEIEFFPFSEKGVIKATFERFDLPEKVDFKDSRNENGTMYVMGKVNFELGGKSYSFKAYSYESTWDTLKHMMFFIKDQSSGKTTYGGGRVVEFDYDKNSLDANVEVNFNRAYAFLCAHSKFYNCPLILTEKIQTNLEYGEKLSSKK